MPPVMFEQIDAEIADERRNEPTAAATPPAPNPAALADTIRRELAVIEMRRSRVQAD
jgi:hypothetical protein